MDQPTDIQRQLAPQEESLAVNNLWMLSGPDPITCGLQQLNYSCPEHLNINMCIYQPLTGQVKLVTYILSFFCDEFLILPRMSLRI